VRGVANGTIEVEFELEEKELVLTVTDNGVGLQHEEATAGHRSMALEITRERLRMLGGKPDSLQFVSPLPGSKDGTRVSLRIPYII
jgi:signal transduction histidine kinase